MGLRERKKERTRETIAATAIRLFLDKGFDQVTISEIAEAAEICRRTLFMYFRTKEELVLHRFADHEGEAARIVRARPAGQPPLEALRAAVLDALAHRDPSTGLCDDPEVMALLRMILDTENLAARMIQSTVRGTDALADALRETGVDPLAARLVAAQVIVMQRELAVMNQKCLAGGASADDRYPDAVRAAERAFDLLRDGLGRHGQGREPAARQPE